MKRSTAIELAALDRRADHQPIRASNPPIALHDRTADCNLEEDCDNRLKRPSESSETPSRPGMDAWIYRIPPKPKAEKAGGAKPPPSVLDLGRRSGRFPPEPYPPLKQIDFNKACGLA